MANTNISFLYESELISSEFNQRFADLLGGSVLAGFRFQLGSGPRSINLIRGEHQSSVLITNKGARIEEFDDVRDQVHIELNDTPTVRVDSIYAAYTHGSGNTYIDYIVIKGYPNGLPVPMMNKEIYTFLGYVKVPPGSNPLTNDCLLPINIGINKLEIGDKASFKGESTFEGPVQMDRELLVKGGVSFDGDVNFKGKVTSSRHPVEDLEVATKAYVDAIITGLAPKEAVVVATTINVALHGSQVIDGVILNSGDRVLVKNQTNPAENGIYVVQIAGWNRSADADNAPNGENSEVRSGMYCWVQKGDTNADSGWVLSTDGEIVLDVTPLTFVKFSQSGTPLATPESDGLMSALDKRRSDGYVHNQMVSSNVWSIKHNLEKYPSVTVVDSAGSKVIGDVEYISIDEVKVTFMAPFSGKVFLN